MFEPGELLGAYRIVRPLGAGGMGRVYEAEHVELKARRALKVFMTGSEHSELLRKRFVAEGRILADLRHPRLLRVYDFAVDEMSGVPYFAMDLVVSPTGEPQTLEDACKAGVDEGQVAGWFRDICEGLDHIHSCGIVHRDISLDNILIDHDGHAVLSDFGIAKIVGDEYRRKIDVTVTMLLPASERLSWGKGLYMAPEMKAGAEATPASDAYAVGVLLFRLLAGSWYTSDTRLNDALAGLECNWAEIITRLCAPKPSDRLGSGGMLDVLSRLRRHDRRSQRFSRLALPVLVLLTIAVVLTLWRWKVGGSTAEDGQPFASGAPSEHSTPIYHIVDITNYVNEKVYQIIPVPVTNAASSD